MFEKDYFPNADEQLKVGLIRMALFHQILALYRLSEVEKRYSDLVPPSVKQPWKQLQAELKSRGILDFRNRVVGHIWDGKYKRPLANREVREYLARFGEKDAFLSWIQKRGERFPETVVSICERFRNELMDTHQVDEQELVG